MNASFHFRRTSDRLILCCPTMFSGMPAIGEGVVLNLSLRGCTVEGHSTVLNGSFMKLRLFLPDDDLSLRVELAAVRWVRDHYFGVEFLHMPVRDRTRLERFLAAYRSSARRPASIL